MLAREQNADVELLKDDKKHYQTRITELQAQLSAEQIKIKEKDQLIAKLQA